MDTSRTPALTGIWKDFALDGKTGKHIRHNSYEMTEGNPLQNYSYQSRTHGGSSLLPLQVSGFHGLRNT
jgi:hypothetical protein